VLNENISKSSQSLPKPKEAAKEPEPTTPLRPDFLYAAIEKIRPENSVIVQESLSTLKALHQQIPISQPGSFFAMSSATLGYGLPAAVGVAMAEKKLGSKRKVIAIIGDGSANYTLQALWTAAKKECDVAFIIVVNKHYDILKSFAKFLQTPGLPGLTIDGISFVDLAKGYGIGASRVEDPNELHERLAELFNRKVPGLLEVRVDDTVPPLLG
jgi:benzoylformate decarboxylase